MAKYSQEQRLAVIQHLLEEKPQIAVAKELGISRKVLYNCRCRCERGGYEQLQNKSQHFTSEFNLKTITYRHKNKLSYMQAAANMCILDEGTLYARQKIYEEPGADGMQDTRGSASAKLVMRNARELN